MYTRQLWQVSFGIWETEERAARQYDRALIVEKGRAAKTNFPLATYEAEVVHFEALLRERHAILHSGLAKRTSCQTCQLCPVMGSLGTSLLCH